METEAQYGPDRRDRVGDRRLAGFMDMFPIGSLMNRSLTLRTGQCHVQKYMPTLLEKSRNGDIDPSFVITHTMNLSQAAKGCEMFLNKVDHCEKVVLKAS